MTEQELLQQLHTEPNSIKFSDVIDVIDRNYSFQPVAFTVGEQHNKAGENQGSCKLFAFAQKHQLNAEQTPYLFGQYYREDVLSHPEGKDHQNIRNFLKYGWKGVKFEAEGLKPQHCS